MAFDDDNMMIFRNVRLAYPHFQEEGKYGYGAKVLLHKEDDAEQIAAVDAHFAKLAKEHPDFKGKLPPSDKRCMRDGDDLDNDAFEGYMVLSANAKSAVGTVDQHLADQEDDSIFYSGCRGNIKVEIYAQKHETGGKQFVGKAVFAQFWGDDDPIGPGQISRSKAQEGFGATAEADDEMFS